MIGHTNLISYHQDGLTLRVLPHREYSLHGKIKQRRHAEPMEKMLSSKVTIHKLVAFEPGTVKKALNTCEVEAAATMCYTRHCRAKRVVPTERGVIVKLRHGATCNSSVG